MKTLGEVIKEKRLEKGLKQSELADEISAQATISDLENRLSMPNLPILVAIGYYKSTLTWMLSEFL